MLNFSFFSYSQFFSLVLFSNLLISCGSDSQEMTSDLQSHAQQSRILGGSDDSEALFPAVVRITQGPYGCSATFVSPSTVLTAAHCIEPGGGPISYGSMKTNKFFIHPDYGQQWWNHDVAIVVFDKAASENYLPISSVQATPSEVFTIVGYGVTDLYGKSEESKRRFGYNIVKSVDAGRIVFRGRDESGSAEGEQLALNGPGDSGGPMIIDGRIVGVSSSISVEEKGKGRNGNYTNLNFAPIRAFFDKLKTQQGLDIFIE